MLELFLNPALVFGDSCAENDKKIFADCVVFAQMLWGGAWRLTR